MPTNSPEWLEASDLNAGESKSCHVDAQECWGRTGILLRVGATYGIEVSDVQDWRDNSIPSDPERGQLVENWLFRLPFIGYLRRYQNAPWYSLVGAIGKDNGSYFKIGYGTQIKPDREGELLVFANDAPGFYSNNHGTLTLKVTRQS